MAYASYRADIFNAGTTSYSTGAVEFSLVLTNAPTINGPVIRPYEGRTETRPWVLSALDANGVFTAQLAGSDGRTDLINRVVQVRRSLNGGTYAVIGGGRLRDVSMGEGVATYDVSVEQETAVDRSALIFNTSNTTRLYPPSPHTAYGPFGPLPKGRVYVAAIGRNNGTVLRNPTPFRIKFTGSSGIFGQVMPLTDLGMEAIRKNVKPFTSPRAPDGNFQQVRCRIGASTYPILSFSEGSQSGQQPGPNVLEGLEDQYTNNTPLEFWIAAPATNSLLVGQYYSSAFLHMFSAPPSEATPLHITTVHPMTLKRQLMNGAYAASGQPRARYSTAAFNDGSTGLERIPMPMVRFRITEPALRREFIERQLNAPNGVCDFLDSSGRVRPRRVWLPATTAAFTFTFTGANMRDPHPSWLQPGRDMVTEVRVAHTDEQWVIGGLSPALVSAYQRPTNAGADFIRANPSTSVKQHDRITRLGLQPITVEANGVHDAVIPAVPFPPDPDPNLTSCVESLSREVFDRFGDGPIQGTIYGMSTAADAVNEGDFCRLTLNTFPNPGIAARGGTRLIQVMGKSVTPYGPEFTYLDAGANLNALTPPTVTLALSTQDRKHTVLATVGSVTTGLGFQMDIAVGSTLPSSTSPRWQRVQTSNASSGIHPLRARPAGAVTWARVRKVAPGRVRSAWANSTAGRTSSGLAAPVIGVSSVAGRSFTVTIIPSTANPGYPIESFIDGSTAAAFSASNSLRIVPAGTRLIPVDGVANGTKYLVGVRHIDPYGGVSPADSTTVTTLSSGTLRARAPLGFYVYGGTT